MKTKRKTKSAGAPKGNKNALKHGFYSKNYTPAENKILDEIEATDITSEINILRVQLAKLLEQIDFDPIMVTDAQLNQVRNAHYLEQLNTMTSITIAIGSHIRTYFLTKKHGDVAQSILEAIMALDPYKEL